MSDRQTSGGRYAHRRRVWRDSHRFLPGVRHHAWWLLHNCSAHPVLAVSPTNWAVWFHDWTSQHLNQRRRFIPSSLPEIPEGRLHAWVFHNAVCHVAIGLVPIGPVFRFHDRTAETMGVEDWL
jgi:hypothetical protein